MEDTLCNVGDGQWEVNGKIQGWGWKCREKGYKICSSCKNSTCSDHLMFERSSYSQYVGPEEEFEDYDICYNCYKNKGY